MTAGILRKKYFLWMINIVGPAPGKYRRKNYRDLLEHMNHTEFVPFHPMDENRVDDGIELRYRFGREEDIPDAEISVSLDNRECSVLEIMVSLAIRMEETITSDPDYGDRTGLWFWDMVESMRLMNMDDIQFAAETVDRALNRMIHREYASNGLGGLFTVQNPREDMRNVEIWYQMMWWLTENLH